jgi:hypothetical protein
MSMRGKDGLTPKVAFPAVAVGEPDRGLSGVWSAEKA